MAACILPAFLPGVRSAAAAHVSVLRCMHVYLCMYFLILIFLCTLYAMPFLCLLWPASCLYFLSPLHAFSLGGSNSLTIHPLPAFSILCTACLYSVGGLGCLACVTPFLLEQPLCSALFSAYAHAACYFTPVLEDVMTCLTTQTDGDQPLYVSMCFDISF